MGAPPPAASTAEESLHLLLEGNARFVAQQSTLSDVTTRRMELAAGQSPFAIVLGCSDSRVPIETVFDQVPGHLFVVRLAGNFLDDNGLASIEYSVAVLGSSLIVVLGHSGCGAVDATVRYLRDGTVQPGHIQRLVNAVEPAARAVQGQPGDWIDNAVAENVRLNVAAMTASSTIIADAVNRGSLQVVGGIYDLHGGKVAFLQTPDVGLGEPSR
jgi:carbonic anhydrase